MADRTQRALGIARRSAHQYAFDRAFQEGGEVALPQITVRPDDEQQPPDDTYDPLAVATSEPSPALARIGRSAVDWWKAQPSWLEQAAAVRQQSDPTSPRPSPVEIEFASGMVGPAAIRATGALSAQDALKMFRGAMGREHGSVPTDLPLQGRGDAMLPAHVTPKDFASEVAAKANDIKQWNNPQRRYWYENSGRAINEAVGADPEMADRVTAAVAKTSQGTPVLDNAAYTARGHAQAMVGEPINTGRYPNDMGRMLEQYYHDPQVGVIGPKITGYQSGFRSAWAPVMNEGANDIWNMRWLGYGAKYKDTPTMGQHNYDKLLRSAVTDRLNAEGYDGGNWVPGQVQAVNWAKQRAGSGIPEEEAGYDIAQALHDRAMDLTYESAPGKTSNHFPEYHSAPLAQKQEYHDAINNVLMDAMGRDRIAAQMGLLTLPTRHGVGVFGGEASPGSAARVVTGSSPGGWKAGIDPATKELVTGGELARGLLLRQDAVAGHYPVFREMPMAARNTVDVRTYQPMTATEGRQAAAALAAETGSTFFSPIHTEHGYRFLNVPEVSGVSNKDFQAAVARMVRRVYAERENVDLAPGYSDSIYHTTDWRTDNGQGYLAQARSQRPDVQRRISEILATLGPRISAVEADFAKRYGWTPDPASRVWERNPGYQAHDFAAVPVGQLPQPWMPQTRQFYPELLRRRGGKITAGQMARRHAHQQAFDQAFPRR